MGAFSALPLGRRPVHARCLVVYRADPRAVLPILPGSLRPRLFAGHAIAAACYTRLGAPALFRRRRAPAPGGSEHLAYRIAVELEDGRAATWIARRETSSWLEARCGARLCGGEYARSTFQLREDAFALELSVSGAHGESFYLRGEVAAEARGSLFPSPQALEAFLGEARGVRPYDVFAPEADELDLAEHFAPEPLCVFEARADYFRSAPFAPGTIELDSAWRIVSRRTVPVVERRRVFRELPGTSSSPALPTV